MSFCSVSFKITRLSKFPQKQRTEMLVQSLVLVTSTTFAKMTDLFGDEKILPGADRTSKELETLLTCCMEKLEKVELSLSSIADMENRVSEKGFEVQNEIKRTAESMVETIQQRKCEISAQVRSTMKAKHKALGAQKNKLVAYVQSLKSSIEYSKDILDSDDSDASQWKPALVGFLKEVLEEAVDHEPAANESFELTVNEEEYMFDLEEFFTRLCTRRRSHLSSNGHLKC